MDAVLAAFLSAGLTVLGTGLLQARHQQRKAGLTVLGTGLLQARHQQRKAEDDDERRLARALSEFGFALDALILELQQLPLARRRTVASWEWIEKHAPGFDSLIGRLGRLLFGRELYAAIERLQKATNELMLIAPPFALEALEPIFSRLDGFAARDENWLAQLQEDRAGFAEVSRSIVSPDF